VILREGLRIARRINEWGDKINDWKDRLFELPPDRKNALATEFWTTALMAAPSMVMIVYKEDPEYLELLWKVLESSDDIGLSEQAVEQVEKILISYISLSSLKLNGVEVFLKKCDSQVLRDEIRKTLTSLDACKTYKEHLTNLGYSDGSISTIVKEKVENFLEDFENFDWIISNIAFVKEMNIMDILKTNAVKWSKSAKNIDKIIAHKNTLELDETGMKKIASNAVALVGKSANLDYLQSPNVLSILTKEDRILIFGEMRKVLSDKSESLDKRKTVSEFMLRANIFWGDVSNDDVYENLKELKKIRLNNSDELKSKPKEILETWGYDEDDKGKPSSAVKE
jgi:hypothetical protein